MKVSTRSWILPASTLRRSSRSSISVESWSAAWQMYFTCFSCSARQLAVEPVQQDLRQRQDRVHGRAELVTHARQESRLGLVGGAQVRGALVELRIQRHHAAVRVFELGIQPRQLFLAQPQLFQAAQQVAILLLHFDARVARAMRGDRASERFDARPRERLGASRHDACAA